MLLFKKKNPVPLQNERKAPNSEQKSLDPPLPVRSWVRSVLGTSRGSSVLDHIHIGTFSRIDSCRGDRKCLTRAVLEFGTVWTKLWCLGKKFHTVCDKNLGCGKAGYEAIRHLLLSFLSCSDLPGLKQRLSIAVTCSENKTPSSLLPSHQARKPQAV